VQQNQMKNIEKLSSKVEDLINIPTIHKVTLNNANTFVPYGSQT